jgi:hypothetical protein
MSEELLPGDIGRIDILLHVEPLLDGLPQAARVWPVRVAAGGGTLAPPIRKGASVGRMVEDGPYGRVCRRFPTQLSGERPDRVAARQEDLFAVERAAHLSTTPQGGERLKDQRHDVADLLIRVCDHPAIGEADEAGRQGLAIDATLDLAEPAGVQPQAEPVQLCL